MARCIHSFTGAAFTENTSWPAAVQESVNNGGNFVDQVDKNNLKLLFPPTFNLQTSANIGTKQRGWASPPALGSCHPGVMATLQFSCYTLLNEQDLGLLEFHMKIRCPSLELNLMILFLKYA